MKPFYRDYNIKIIAGRIGQLASVALFFFSFFYFLCDSVFTSPQGATTLAKMVSSDN